MSLRKGALVWVSGKSVYLSKPRPAVIVQAGVMVDARDSLTVCPLTTELSLPFDFRVRLTPSTLNNLEKVSEVMVDKIVTIPKSVVEAPFGLLSPYDIGKLNRALRLWLGL